MLKVETAVKLPRLFTANSMPFSQNNVFFDIETTGLHRRYSHIYMIGILFQDRDRWQMLQWFAEKPSDEPAVIQAFLQTVSAKCCLIHYNGDSFDLPYLRAKCAFYNLDFKESYHSFDIYRRIRPYQKMLGLSNLTQRDAEDYIGIHRKDLYTGAELISVYKEYLQTADAKLLDILLLHNREDILNMTALLSLNAYPALFEKTPTINNLQQEDDCLVLFLSVQQSLPQPVFIANRHYSLEAAKSSAILRIHLTHHSLKYYYENYKDYYYLPAEDRAIHKSVGIYVDKEHREPAKASNCYQWKEGVFAPQYETLFQPALKENAKDPFSYFPYDHNHPLSDVQWTQYAASILQTLKKER